MYTISIYVRTYGTYLNCSPRPTELKRVLTSEFCRPAWLVASTIKGTMHIPTTYDTSLQPTVSKYIAGCVHESRPCIAYTAIYRIYSNLRKLMKTIRYVLFVKLY